MFFGYTQASAEFMQGNVSIMMDGVWTEKD